VIGWIATFARIKKWSDFPPRNKITEKGSESLAAGKQHEFRSVQKTIRLQILE